MILFFSGYDINFYSKKSIAGSYEVNSSRPPQLLPRYELGPGDNILIRVFGYDEFNSKVIVLPDGTINVSRIGSINVNGLTLKDAKTILSESYSTNMIWNVFLSF